MQGYKVLLIVSYKASARDPEGETIAHELRSLGHEEVVSVRAGKAFLFEVKAGSEEDAIESVTRIASETKLYNPSVHEVKVMRVA
ncbi:MAG: phosphoribosylformylglycinamidine synthase subunit PurS [Caldisphaeraceae archaeon]|nr:phosphoribosylformylglycinamidine synthase subunit PurS [Caldisphaeraceae archaeon]